MIGLQKNQKIKNKSLKQREPFGPRGSSCPRLRPPSAHSRSGDRSQVSANLSGLTQRAALGRHPTHTPLPPWWLVPGSVCGDLRLPHPRVWTVAVPARRHGHQWGVRKPRAAPGGDRWRAGWPFSPPHVPQSQEPGGRPRLCLRCRREHGGHRPPRRLLCSRVLRGPSPSQSDRRGRDLWNSLRTATSRG